MITNTRNKTLLVLFSLAALATKSIHAGTFMDKISEGRTPYMIALAKYSIAGTLYVCMQPKAPWPLSILQREKRTKITDGIGLLAGLVFIGTMIWFENSISNWIANILGKQNKTRILLAKTAGIFLSATIIGIIENADIKFDMKHDGNGFYDYRKQGFNPNNNYTEVDDDKKYDWDEIKDEDR